MRAKTTPTPAARDDGAATAPETAVLRDAAAQVGIAPTASQWAELLSALRRNTEADIEVAATVNARAMKKALRPENEIAPGVSIFNPQGEVAHPRPKPTHIFMMGPYPICEPSNYDTSTGTEITLCNQLQPGDYLVTKADGVDVKATVKTEYQGNGKTPYRTTIHIPMADDEQKNNWVPLMQLLTQIVTGESPMQSFARYQAVIDAREARIRDLEAQLATV